MSVYIKVSHSILNRHPSKKIYMMACSQNSILITKYVEPTKKPYWMADILCSFKEKRIYFHIYQQNHQDGQHQLLIGSAVLKFSSFAHLISAQQSYQPTIKLQKNGQSVGQIYLVIFYNRDKKYIGDLQYGQDTCGSKSKMLTYNSKANLKTDVSLNQAKTRHDLYQQSRYKSTQFLSKNKMHSEGKVIFYKGPCKTTNLFSCCDAVVEGQKFQIIENLYRDEK